MARFPPQIPDPWTDDLPCLLPPAIGIVLLIFLSQRRFKRPAMQRPRHHLSSCKSGRRPCRRASRLSGFSLHEARMRGNHRAGALLAACVQGVIEAIGEHAHDPTFRMGERVIGRKRDPGCDHLCHA